MADQGKPQGKLTTAPAQNKITKIIGIGGDGLDPQDKKVICKAICYCEVNPNKGGKKGDRNQHQTCVSERLGELDRFLHHQSPYKPEVNYDMHKNPPAPIMETDGILTKVHDYLPGWIKKYWEDDKGYPYQKGEGMVRRPDVIIVKDPTKPPTQDNIKQVIEIKFGTDVFDEKTKKDYEEIAGSPNKVKVLDPNKCDCSSDDDDHGKTSTVLEYATWAAGVILAALQLRKGKMPKFPKFPSPKPAPASIRAW